MTMGKIAPQLLSPGRIAFVGYLVAIYLGKVETTKAEFLIVSVLYLLIDILHNDYIRIWLNKRAER